MKGKISDNFSEAENVLSTVLQGSVLGYLFVLIFKNNLPNDRKSEIKLFANDVERFARVQSKDKTQMDLNKVSC